MRRRQTMWIRFSLITLLALAGCGGKKDGGKKAAADAGQQSQPQATNEVTAASRNHPVPASSSEVDAAKLRLLGTWSGRMEVNKAKVAETLRAKMNGNIDDQTIQDAIVTLQSLKMEIGFRADGGMNLNASLDEGPETTEASGVGKWELLHVKNDDVLIRSMEVGKEPEEVQIHFENDHEFSMQPPTEYAGIGMMRFRKLR